ncbi:hypothetical protein L6452_26730 [Arctium lappa]|uniref:Uncharacterized protein n=1 Tax=Arctium lappa TaxID=4217 RepID=A0ACB8ZV37_ARCLA|nr:hypothetical protein L6452_26730 [Arctium lappa]
MAKPQAFNVSNTTPPSIIMEHEQEGSDDYYNPHDDDAVSGNGCGCFRLFSYFDNRHHDGSETTAFIHHRLGDTVEKDSWLMIRFKRLKELSELVAGPKWKNFIRKFSKKPKKGNSQFQYDPESYALNFNDDCGGGGGDGDDDFLSRSFSTRFAPHSRSTAT